ncbi:MAG TPA: hypothetical protein VK907_09475 [Phnomibacter sp.]|nr:hypothetical protein [Phnomibacter sp.]
MSQFDDNMKDRAGNFRLEPREQVWQRIENELGQRRRRRGIVWLWWVLPLALTGIGIYTYHNFTRPAHEVNQIFTPDTLPTPDLPTPQTHPTPMAGAGRSQSPDPPTQGLSETHEKAPATHTPSYPVPSAGSTIRQMVEHLPPAPRSHDPIAENSEKAADSLKPALAEISISKGEELKAQHLPEAVKDASIGTTEMVDTARANLQNAEIEIREQQMIADTSYQQEPIMDWSAPAMKKNRSTGRWGVVAGIGLHNHAGSGIELQKSAAGFNNALPQYASGPGSGMGTPTALEPTKPGIGFMLGLERTQNFGIKGRWNWMAGIHYQYQSIRLATGARKDSAISLETDMGGNLRGADANYFYKAGADEKQTGYQHRMHLVAALQWYLDKNKKLLWHNGLYGGVVLANDYLYPQGPYIGWVPSKNIINRGYLGIETGFRYQPGQWGLGIYGQYNLTTSSNKPALPNQYWRGIELRMNRTITTKNK